MTPEELVGKEYIFEDQSVISVIQVKAKEIDSMPDHMVTYTISYGTNLPRKLVMPFNTFMGNFGHLFEAK
jgi:hypothetical protein